MKETILTIFLAFMIFSCSNDETIEPFGLTLEEAESVQIISFNIGERNVELTEFKNDSWPFGAIVSTDSIEFDPNTHYPISRTIYATVPEDQVLNYHIETFGLEFNQVFSKSEIDMDSNKTLSNEKFKSDFLNIGEQRTNLSNFGFHQTYLIGIGQAERSSLRITHIENILEHDNLILVTGEFNGSVGYEHMNLTNGQFKVIIEN